MQLEKLNNCLREKIISSMAQQQEPKPSIKNIMLNKKKLVDKTLSIKRRDCSGEHLLHEAFTSMGDEQAAY